MEEDVAKRSLLLLKCSPTLPLPPLPRPSPSPHPVSPPPLRLQSFDRRRTIRFTTAYDKTSGITNRWSSPADPRGPPRKDRSPSGSARENHDYGGQANNIGASCSPSWRDRDLEERSRSARARVRVIFVIFSGFSVFQRHDTNQDKSINQRAKNLVSRECWI